MLQMYFGNYSEEKRIWFKDLVGENTPKTDPIKNEDEIFFGSN